MSSPLREGWTFGMQLEGQRWERVGVVPRDGNSWDTWSHLGLARRGWCGWGEMSLWAAWRRVSPEREMEMVIWAAPEGEWEVTQGQRTVGSS